MSKRWINFAGFAVCAALLAYAYYLQFYEYLDPCPLCILQRIAVVALGISFLLAGAFAGWRVAARGSALLIAASAGIGAAIAGWHVRLQHLPADQIPECGPGLEFMLRTLPLNETLSKVFTASGECAEISWQFLGLSMPAWVMLWFIALGIAGSIYNWRRA
ncbi:MAG: disulfide bond formation protein B [Gammaproteobacteria bacterium]|nr:disulfide bond formation protein B [Gammaproteobacteria bacterium]